MDDLNRLEYEAALTLHMVLRKDKKSSNATTLPAWWGLPRHPTAREEEEKAKAEAAANASSEACKKNRKPTEKPIAVPKAMTSQPKKRPDKIQQPRNQSKINGRTGMPESYLWLLNHVGNAFTLSTKQHKFAQLHNTWNEAVTVKRLSSSSWCAWGLGHDHRVYIYIFSSDVPIRVPDTLYENQRYLPFHGFSKRGLLPMDRFAWSDERGVKDTPKESFRLPSAHWTWEGNWMVDENLRGEVAGVEGWQYAVDFPSSHYTPEKHWKSCVRKRKWIRFRRFTSTDIWVRISDMEVVENSECFIDISVGGFYLPSQPPGFLSVWAVTNSGHVYVRNRVCHDKPEGDNWRQISLGSNRGVVNICVGASNLVWAVTWDGQALVRTGINRNKIHGTQWEIVECPDDSIRFMQVAVGKNVVWALSREGKVWFRKGTCGDDIEGNISSFIGSLWVEMVGTMSYLSVTANDQVFALDANDGSVYYRTGITSSNLTGKTWQKISLHEDTSIFQSMASEMCTCSPEDARGSPSCEFHKCRTASFTTSYSSTNTSIETDEPLSDALLSPQSPEPIPPSSNVESTENNCEYLVEQHSPKEKDLYDNSIPQHSSDISVKENDQISSDKEDVPSSAMLVNNFDTDENKSVEDTIGNISSSQCETKGSHTPNAQHTQVPDEQPINSRHNDDLKAQFTESVGTLEEKKEVNETPVNNRVIPPPNDNKAQFTESVGTWEEEEKEVNETPGNNRVTPPTDSTNQTNKLHQTSEGTKIKSFVEELTEVDRFLVEREILQSSYTSILPPVLLNSSNKSNLCDEPNDNRGAVVSKDDDRDSFPEKESNTNTKTELDENEDPSHDQSVTATAELSKPPKHKHKSKHPKRPDRLSLDNESDSIVYKSPKGKKKKKKIDLVKEPLNNNDNNVASIDSKTEMEVEKRLSEKVNQTGHDNQPDDSFCEMKKIEESSQHASNNADIEKHKVDVSENVVLETGCGKDRTNVCGNDRTNECDDDVFETEGENTLKNKNVVLVESKSDKEEIHKSENVMPEPTSVKANSRKSSLPINPDVKFQPNSPDSNAGDSAMPCKPITPTTNQPDSLSNDGRKFSLDSPVSDRIFDFVSFVDENDEEEDYVDSSSNAKNLVHQESVVSMSSSTNSKFSENELPFSQYSTVQRQQSVYSELASPDEKLSESSCEMSSVSAFAPTMQAQMIPLKPARKIFKYRSTPSPSAPSNQGFAALDLDPETLTQTRYAWRLLDVSALHVDDPSTVKWLNFKNKDKEEKKNAPKISASLRNDIMTKLKARNRREIYQFHNFEQAVKNSTWVKKSRMKLYVRRGGGLWTDCSVELEQSKADQASKCLSVIYFSKKNQKVKQVTLKEVTCIKGSTSPDLIRTTLIIYTSNDIYNPVVLQAASEEEAKEWMSLLCSACATQCNLDSPILAGSVWSCTKSGAILVSPCKPSKTKSGDFVWGLHGGHMNLIETGSCGVTWGIGFDRLAYVYNGGYGGAVCTDIPSMSDKLQEMTDFHRIYVYEHQTRYPVVGWCSKGMLGNHFNWTTEAGQSLASQDDVKLPSSKWQWVSSWTVDFNTSGGVDSDGWQFSTIVGDFHRGQHIKDMYRRRRWVRTCRLYTRGPWDSAGSLSLHDVSIQVDPVVTSSDAIVLWAVGTNGNVLCRCGVTKGNPLGHSWVHIPTDLDKPFISISVGGGWRVWGIAGDGSTWYRSGVTQYSPAGKCWLQVVEPPSGNGILKQVSAGTTAVWAVDTEDNLWRRKNITRTFPEGTDWDQVASRVKRVNVGYKDEVWIIADSRFNHTSETAGSIYRRAGITEDKPRGTRWEKVIGEGWSYVSVRGIEGKDAS